MLFSVIFVLFMPSNLCVCLLKLVEFKVPVDPTKVRDYRTFVVNPVDLCTIEQQVRAGAYSTAFALHADVKWLVHNSVIYNGNVHRLTKNAKLLEKNARLEALEIDKCPDCYVRFRMQDELRTDAFPDLCVRQLKSSNLLRNLRVQSCRQFCLSLGFLPRFYLLSFSYLACLSYHLSNKFL